MTISKQVLGELLSGVESAGDFLGDQGLVKELKVRLMEGMLCTASGGAILVRDSGVTVVSRAA